MTNTTNLGVDDRLRSVTCSVAKDESFDVCGLDFSTVIDDILMEVFNKS